MQEYRELKPEEEEALFANFCKNNGVVQEMIKDPQCKYRSADVVGFYRKKYEFTERFAKIRAEEAKQEREEWKEKVKQGKLAAIQRAIELMQPREIPIFDKKTGEPTGEMATIYPSSKDIKIAWEILKIESGEPTHITRNTNIDEKDEEVKEALDGLHAIIKAGQKKLKEQNEPRTEQLNSEVQRSEGRSQDDPTPIQGGGKTIDDTPQV